MHETLVNKYAVCKESGKDESHVYLVLFSGVQHASLEPTSPLSLLSLSSPPPPVSASP